MSRKREKAIEFVNSEAYIGTVELQIKLYRNCYEVWTVIAGSGSLRKKGGGLYLADVQSSEKKPKIVLSNSDICEVDTLRVRSRYGPRGILERN